MTDPIARIYDCALRPSQWPEVLQDIATEAGAFGAMLFDCEWSCGQERVDLRYCSTAFDPAIVELYVKANNAYEVVDQARFAALSSQNDDVDLIRCDDLYPTRALLEARPNMQAMMGLGVHFRAGALLSKDTAAMDRFALQFRKYQGPISEAARLKVRGLLPHVAKALSIGRAFQAVERQKASLTGTLEAIPFGIGIVTSNGDIVFSNTEFVNLCEAYALLRRANHQLNLSTLPAAMQSLLQSAATHGKFGARPLREATFLQGARENAGLFVEICPIADHPGFERFNDFDLFGVRARQPARSHDEPRYCAPLFSADQFRAVGARSCGQRPYQRRDRRFARPIA